MQRIALVTARAARGLDEDMPLLLAALHAAGVEAIVVDWDDGGVDWSRFDLALLRSSWDYTQRLPAFLAWIARVEQCTRLLNPPAVIRWNADKHYLRELAQAGVPVVSTAFVEPEDNADKALDSFLAAHPKFDEFVVKPCIGAGSRDAQRHGTGDRDAAAAHIRRLLDAGRSALLQPYLRNVDEHGETALLYFDGGYSHAIRKGPLLKRGQGPVQALFATEQITPRRASDDERKVGKRALAAIPFDQPLLYVRVDLIRNDEGSPRVLELELAEPSVFLEYDAGSAARFAAAILRCI